MERTVEGNRLYNLWDEKEFHSGSEDDPDNFHEVEEDEYCHHKIYLETGIDLDGHQVAEDIDFDEEDFIQSKPFTDVKPYHEWFKGFRGNKSVTARHDYHRTVRLYFGENLAALT